MLLQSAWNPNQQYSSQDSLPLNLQSIQENLKPGWSAHLTADNRIYYSNGGSCSWIPPVEAWSKEVGRGLPYGWEEAVDNGGKTYYINHVNKTTTYEEPVLDWSEEPPQPRSVTLTRHPEMGFGFVAGSERPVIVRFVTEGGPSDGKLLPGDHILEVNSEDVSCAPRDHVIQLVRASKTSVQLVVCQPVLINSLRKSAILSSAKKAKLKSNPSRVRFAEGVVVNGSPLFPGCTLSGGDWGSGTVLPNVLKVFLENGQTKSFKYDSNTTVGDVLSSLQSKLCLKETAHFALVLEQVKTLRRNKLTLLDPRHTLARVASRPGTHNLRCLFRVAFVPSDPCDLAQKDLSAFEYFYLQCCNDVVQERYAPELKYDVALRLAALHIHQHCLANNIQPSKITVKSVERDFGLERFVPSSLLETMKRKELRKVLTHLLKLNYTMTGTSHKCLTALQAKLYYLTIISQLPSYGAKCFPTNTMVTDSDTTVENVILVSPKLGISQITGLRSNMPIPVADIEQLSMVQIQKEDHLLSTVALFLPSSHNKELRFTVEERDAEELVLVLQGYFKLFTSKDLPVHSDPDDWIIDTAPLYHSQHIVRPAVWSYGPETDQNEPRMVNFAIPLHTLSQSSRQIKANGNGTLSRNNSRVIRSNGVDNNMNVPGKVKDRNGMKPLSPGNNGIDFHSVVSMEILERDGYIEAHNPEVMRRVAEMQAMVESSEEYLSKHQREGSDSHLSVDCDTPAPLKHSDSLLLLTQGQKEIEECVNEAFNSLDVGDTESDTDSLTTSPSHNSIAKNPNRDSDSSFGLHSPDTLSTYEALQEVWKKVQETGNYELPGATLCLDPDIIDLTLLPPPATPDKITVGAEELLSLGLEEFLESTKVVPPPPTTVVDPTINLTTEQISAFIIPPPPPPSMDEDVCKQNGIASKEEDIKACYEKQPERPPKVSYKYPPPLPPRSDSFIRKQADADVNVEALKITADFSDRLSLALAQTDRNINKTQEVKDMLGLELRRLVTSSKLLVRSHKCANTTLEAGDYCGNLQTVTSQLRKVVEYGVTMEPCFVLGVLKVVTEVQGIIVSERQEDLSGGAERLASALASLIKHCHP